MNFPVTNSNPWMQTYNGDVRTDAAKVDNIPSAPTCPAVLSSQDNGGVVGKSPGVVYFGDTDTAGKFGQGAVSVPQWLVGGTTYSELYGGGQLVTSYNSLLAEANKGGLTIKQMSDPTVCTGGNESDCTLRPNLPSGIYQSNGDVTMEAYTVQPTFNYIFLIKGNLTIKGNIKVQPNGGSAIPATILFSASGNVIVDRSVGTAPACPAPAGQLVGFYSADHDFTIDGYNDCIAHTNDDKMLTMEGSIIVNAARSNGAFTMNRDLCGSNPTTPAFTIMPRLDLILETSPFLTKQQTISQEEAP